MDNNKRNKRHWNNNPYKKENKNYSEKTADESVPERIILNTPTCPICSEPITDLASALTDPNTKEPIHFDCALNIVSKKENITANDKITYIGQGHFAVVHFDNPHDLRKFTIVKTIEWETKDQQPKWRTEISDSFSQIK